MAKGKVRPYADYYCDDPVAPVVRRRNFGGGVSFCSRMAEIMISLVKMTK
jgi:hypothetical protein